MKLTAVRASPLSLSSRLVESSYWWLKVMSNPSTYWWRAASVFGSHSGLRTSFIDLPDRKDSILYGPLASGSLSYFCRVSFSAETTA